MKQCSCCTSGCRRGTWGSSNCTLVWPGREGWCWRCHCVWRQCTPSWTSVRSLWRKQNRRVTELQDAAMILSHTEAGAVSVPFGWVCAATQTWNAVERDAWALWGRGSVLSLHADSHPFPLQPKSWRAHVQHCQGWLSSHHIVCPPSCFFRINRAYMLHFRRCYKITHPQSALYKLFPINVRYEILGYV